MKYNTLNKVCFGNKKRKNRTAETAGRILIMHSRLDVLGQVVEKVVKRLGAQVVFITLVANACKRLTWRTHQDHVRSQRVEFIQADRLHVKPEI